MQEKLSKLTKEVSRYRATGTQLQQALTLAQKTADELKDSARRESELILADAKSKAEVVTNESKQSVRVIKNAYLEFKGEFRAYLTTFLNLLDNMDSSLVGKISVKDKEEEQPPQDQDNC